MKPAMTIDYPYNNIWINCRLVPLAAISSGSAIAETDFENSTFQFLRAWLNSESDFPITTSGSTGQPKTINITRDQMIASAKQTLDFLDLKSGSTCLVCIDTKFIGGRMMLVRALVGGMKILALDPCALPLQNIPVDQCVDFAAFVPYQVENTLESKHPHLLDCLGNVIIGGAPLNESTVRELDKFSCRCYATYAMTETVSHVALRLLNGKDKQPYFRALPGVELSVDERNCLVIRSSYLPDKIITNDIVSIKSATEFEWLGRWDNVINSGGIKLNPEKIESAIQKHFAASGFHHRFFVAAVEDKFLGSKLILLIEGNNFIKEKAAMLLGQLEDELTKYEKPKDVITLDTFAMTPNGKINRVQTLRKLPASS